MIFIRKASRRQGFFLVGWVLTQHKPVGWVLTQHKFCWVKTQPTGRFGKIYPVVNLYSQGEIVDKDKANLPTTWGVTNVI